MSFDYDSISLDLLAQRLKAIGDPDAIVSLASAMTYANLLQERHIVGEVAAIIYRAATDGDVASMSGVCHASAAFIQACATSLRRRGQLAGVSDWGALRQAVREVIALPLSAIFQHECRVRIWALDTRNGKYIGLMALGMKDSFKNEFETDTLTLPREDAPYDELTGTSCLILEHTRVEGFLKKRRKDSRTSRLRSLYLDNDKIGLGSVVPETYTWEFCGDNGEVSWALSFDLGNHNGSRPGLRCDHLVLRMIDKLMLALEQPFAQGLAAVAREAPGTSNFDEEPLQAIEAAASASRPSHDSSIDRQSASPETKSVPIAPAISSQEADRLLHSPLDCIPWTYPGEDPTPRPWVFAKGDPAVDRIIEWWSKTRRRRGTSATLLCGPSGVGKLLLARSLPGDGVRPGPFVPSRWGEDERKALVLLTGGQPYNAPYTPSDVERAGSGVVCIDEALAYIIKGKGFDTLLPVIEDIIEGRMVAEQFTPNARTPRKWLPEALVVFTGSPEHLDIISSHEEWSHWIRRFGDVLFIPSWTELAPESRAAILRWCVLEQLREHGRCKGRTHRKAFQLLVVEPQPTELYYKVNMSGIRRIVEDAATYGKTDGGVLEVSIDVIRDFVKSRVRGLLPALAHAIAAVGDGGDDWLEIGVGSNFEKGLTAFQRLVVQVANCAQTGLECKGCISEESLEAALQSINSVGDVYNAAYLLYAAVRDVAPGDPAVDPRRTASSRYGSHFKNKGPWVQRVKRYLKKTVSEVETEATPADLKIEGPSKGAVGDAFRQHVIENVRDLQSIVERVASAYPPYFHITPYWDWPVLLRSTGQSSDEA